jgi:hypothetical protein
MKMLISIETEDVREHKPKEVLQIIRENLLSTLRPMHLRVKHIGRERWWPAPHSRKGWLLPADNDVYWVEAGTPLDNTSKGIQVRY